MTKKTIRDIDLQGKTVFARLDWNVPLEDGNVVDAFRIEATRPTIEYLLEQNCKIVVASHLGRPDGKADHRYSLEPVASRAADILGRSVTLVPDCIGADRDAAIAAAKPGEILCLENVRFHPEEEANDPAFAQKLAVGCDVFVYDAFASYRPHASTEGIARVLPAVAGLLVEKEVDYITGAIERPNRPLIAIIGGAKVSTKLELLTNLIPKVDAMLLTGPIANTFAHVHGQNVGKSVYEAGAEESVKKLEQIAKEQNTHLLLPPEVVVSKSLDGPKDVRTIPFASVGDNDCIVDAAPSYGKLLQTEIYDFLDFDGRATVVWNGPLGITEIPEFCAGSRAMAEAIIETKATSIIGGGDTASFLDREHLHDKFTWVSTGGGASLELMGGKGLPCVEALLDKAHE